MQQMSLKVLKILNSNGGYGIVLSDGLEPIEEDVRGFVISNQALIQHFIKQRVSQMIVSGILLRFLAPSIFLHYLTFCSI